MFELIEIWAQSYEINLVKPNFTLLKKDARKQKKDATLAASLVFSFQFFMNPVRPNISVFIAS